MTSNMAYFQDELVLELTELASKRGAFLDALIERFEMEFTTAGLQVCLCSFVCLFVCLYVCLYVCQFVFLCLFICLDGCLFICSFADQFDYENN